MAKYVFIESRDPYDSADSRDFLELVEGVSKRGNDTTLFLVQNAVLSARKGAKHNALLAGPIRSKVKVLADEFSLRERAVGKLADGISPSGVDRLVDLILEPGVKAVWH